MRELAAVVITVSIIGMLVACAMLYGADGIIRVGIVMFVVFILGTPLVSLAGATG